MCSPTGEGNGFDLARRELRGAANFVDQLNGIAPGFLGIELHTFRRPHRIEDGPGRTRQSPQSFIEEGNLVNSRAASIRENHGFNSFIRRSAESSRRRPDSAANSENAAS